MCPPPKKSVIKHLKFKEKKKHQPRILYLVNLSLNSEEKIVSQINRPNGFTSFPGSILSEFCHAAALPEPI